MRTSFAKTSTNVNEAKTLDQEPKRKIRESEFKIVLKIKSNNERPYRVGIIALTKTRQRYTATPIASGRAGAVMKVTDAFLQGQ